VVSLTVIVPYTRVAAMLGFGIVPPHFYPILVIVVVGYVISADMAKYIFYRQRA
jgi:hypothetical protein